MYETPYVQTLKMRVFLHHSQMCMYIHVQIHDTLEFETFEGRI